MEASQSAFAEQPTSLPLPPHALARKQIRARNGIHTHDAEEIAQSGPRDETKASLGLLPSLGATIATFMSA